MRAFASAVFTVVVLAWGAQAWATAQDTFVSAFSRIGIGENGTGSKKTCLCIGGPLDGNVGLMMIYEFGGQYRFDCAVPSFDAQGNDYGSANCVAVGGTLVPLSK